MSDVAARYRQIRRRIDDACARAGRHPGEVVLVGASKRQSLERMRAALAAGLTVFGENQVQEAQAKQGELPAAEWHLLGPLQSNKVKRAAGLFSTFHAVDRVKIGRRLDHEARDRGLRLDGFLEVNLGGEESKHGFRPETLLAEARPLAGLAGLRIVGLMAIPPFEEELTRARSWFRQLRELRDALATEPEWHALPGWLSMGMSHDFEAAILEGATHVRVGTALFGERP